MPPVLAPASLDFASAVISSPSKERNGLFAVSLNQAMQQKEAAGQTTASTAVKPAQQRVGRPLKTKNAQPNPVADRPGQPSALSAPNTKPSEESSAEARRNTATKEGVPGKFHQREKMLVKMHSGNPSHFNPAVPPPALFLQEAADQSVHIEKDPSLFFATAERGQHQTDLFTVFDSSSDPAPAAGARHEGMLTTAERTNAADLLLHEKHLASSSFFAAQETSSTVLDKSLINGTARLNEEQKVQTVMVQGVTGGEENDADTPAASGTGAAAQRLDTDTHYIQSRLPKEALGKITGQSSEQQDVNGRQSQENHEPSHLPAQSTKEIDEQPVGQRPDLQQSSHHSQPVILQPPVTGQPAPAGLAPGQPAFFHLPSGLVVPESTVVDQMIAHFTVNHRLESHEVVLRLNPQELGKVRMTITVEQDNVKAHILTQNPQTQEMIDRHLPRLRDALEEHGLHLHQVEVTVATQEQTGDERFQGHDTRHQAASFSDLSNRRQLFSSPMRDEKTAADVSTSSNILNVLI
ncbi:MAG: flagellar hook-length control protein FliK [Desulfobulbus sp.]|nr:flagellar hook-length control protein FliK [Desulfobulbus sp.]